MNLSFLLATNLADLPPLHVTVRVPASLLVSWHPRVELFVPDTVTCLIHPDVVSIRVDEACDRVWYINSLSIHQYYAIVKRIWIINRIDV